METILNLFRNPNWAKRSAVLVAFLLLQNGSALSGESDESSRDAALSKLAQQFEYGDLPPLIKISAKSVFTLNPDYLRLNPSINAAIYGRVEELYDIQMTPERFRVSVNFVPGGPKVVHPPHLLTYDGQNTYTVVSGGQMMQTKKGLKLAPDNSMPLGTLVFLPFSFILSCDEPEKVPILTTALATGKEAWQELKNRTSLAGLSEQGPKLRIKDRDGSYYVVQLSAKDNMYPVSFDRYSSDDKLISTCVVSKLTRYESGRFHMTVPSEMSFRIFTGGFQRSERHITIESVRTDGPPADDLFTPDPATATAIFDEDNHTTIRVPR